MRVGFGYDSHVFEEGRPLMLGGVLIPDAPGLKGHSDADALIHSIVDALYGAAALGDIGSHFPDSDPRCANADSSAFLRAAVDEVRTAGYAIGNVDATVICERPKLRPHVEAIRTRLAELMAIPVSCVSVKGKTNEKMDDVGAGRGIVVHSVVLLV